jgi:endonuclease YncB( thermonuclease family)
MKIIVSVVLAWVACSIAQASELSGVPRVVDGDTLTIGATRVRLEGIDAPETDQVCLDAHASRWTCGIEARNQLTSYIAGQVIRCVSSGTDRYGRTLATCWLGAHNLNGWMVEQGWALAYIQYSSAYVLNQERARPHQVGLWRGAFIAPWDWRHRNQQTERGAQGPAKRTETPVGPNGGGECTVDRVCDQRERYPEWRTHLPSARSKTLRAD